MDAILRLKKRYILILSVLLSEVLTSLMSLLFNGRITYEFLITGGVVSLIVASILIIVVAESQKLLSERDVLQSEVEKHMRDLEETNTSLLQEIEERKLAEERIVALIDALPDIIYFKNTESRNLVVNLSFAKLTGLKKEEVQGKTDMELLPPELAEHCRKQDDEVIRGGRLVRYEEEHDFHGERMFQETIKVPLYDKRGACTGLVGITRDITERMLAEEATKKSLKEKEILLKEIHHRVKNNMAIISALLSLQSRYIDDKKALEKFEETRGRIASMALVHEKLYQTEDFSEIDVKDYVQTLVHKVESAFAMDKSYSIVTDIDQVALDIDILIPCGLIINEILSNAYKHAFVGGDNPTIKVIMKEIDNGEISLMISDNGKGLPEGFDINQTMGLGLKLVRLLTSQIKGKLEVKSDQGTLFSITFPAKLEIARHNTDG